MAAMVGGVMRTTARNRRNRLRKSLRIKGKVRIRINDDGSADMKRSWIGTITTATAPPTDAVFDREVKCVRKGSGFKKGATVHAYYCNKKGSK